MDYRPQTAQCEDLQARDRRIRLRDEERARRMQDGVSIYGQGRPAASPPSVNPEPQRPKTAVQQYADDVFLELLEKGRRPEKSIESMGESTLAQLLPPARYDPVPITPAAVTPPVSTPPPPYAPAPTVSVPPVSVTRPQTAYKLSKEQYKAELLAQIEEDRRRKKQAKASARETAPDLTSHVPARPHMRKQDPNRPSGDNPAAEMYPGNMRPAQRPVEVQTPVYQPTASQSLLDVDWPRTSGNWPDDRPIDRPQQGRPEELILEKERLLLEKQQAREEMLRLKEELLNEKEKRLMQMMQMLQFQAPVYPPPSAPVYPAPYQHPASSPQSFPAYIPSPHAVKKPQTPVRDFAAVESSLRNSSRLIAPEVYTNPSALLFKGDQSPYESLVQEATHTVEVPVTERPLPLHTDTNRHFEDSAVEDIGIAKEVRSSAQQIALSEPRYGRESEVTSRDSLINEYESNFETALLENFSLTSEWKGTKGAGKTVVSQEFECEEEAEVAPYEEDTAVPAVASTPAVEKPTTYTQRALAEYRQQVYPSHSAADPKQRANRASRRYQTQDQYD